MRSRQCWRIHSRKKGRSPITQLQTHQGSNLTSSETPERNFMILSGRTILITGGSAGIGLAFALKFVELGNTVIVTGRRESVLDEVKKRDPKLHTIQSDVADPA